MNYNSKMGYSGNEQDYQLVKASLSKLKLQKELLRYLTNVLPNPTDIVTLDNAQDTVKSVKAQLANKNLFDNNKLVDLGFTLTDGVYVAIASNIGTKTLDSSFKSNTQYTISIKCSVVDGGMNLALPMYYTDGTSAINPLSISPSSSIVTFKVTSLANKTLERIELDTSGNGTFNVLYIQIEEGTTATAYTPYISDFSTVKVTGCGKNLIQTNIIEVTSPNAVNKLIWQGNISGKLSFSLDNSEYINSSTPGAANFEFVFGDGTSKYLAANVQHIYLNTFSPLKEIHFLG